MLQTKEPKTVICAAINEHPNKTFLLFCVPSLSVIDYVVPSGWVIVYNELESIWKGVIIA
jgi:hypothetical protein